MEPALQSAAFYVGPKSKRNFFLGSNVFMSAFGSHTMSLCASRLPA